MKRFTKMMALAAAVVGFGCIASANASVLVTFDVRQAGTDSKDILLTQPNQVITLNIYADVVNNDGDHTNDGIGGVSLRFLSVEDASGALQGNYSGAVKNANFTVGAVGSANAALDGNPDLEWGTTSGTNNTGNFNASTLSTVKGTGAGAGITEILLGQITWTGPAVVPAGSAFTDLTVQPWFNPTTGNGNYVVVSDGVQTSNVTAVANEGFGTGVHVSTAVPEPASLGVLALGGLGLLARRRK